MSMGYVAAGVGGALLVGALGGGGAPAVDPAVGQASLASAEVAADTLQWYKDKDAEMKPYRDEATQIALDQARTQVATAKKQNEMADETYDYTKSTFRPLEQKIASDALGYDTAARRDAEAAQMQADIGTASDAARANLAREVESRGGDVNSGNFTATLGNMAVREAAAKAAGGNQARKNVEAVGAAKLADAAGLGRGIVSTNATQTQLGLQAGNSAVVNAQVPGNIATQQGNMVSQGAGTAINGYGTAGNLSLGAYNARTRADEAANGTTNALLQAGGTALGAYFSSDENAKTDKKPVDGDKAMKAVRKTEVKRWRYRNGVAADDGGQEHVGPMAQDVNKNMGGEAAPGGTVIDPITMNGITLAAIQNVDKRLAKLEKRKRA